MIIASSAKKDISIPLQPMTSAVPSVNSNSLNLFETEETVATAVDLVTVNGRHNNNNGKCVFA